MLTCPRIGQQVVLHYARRAVDAGCTPHHGRVGVVVGRKTKGRPRNHLVQVDDGTVLVVPAGNIRKHPALLPTGEK
jgi:hypothetical protein